MSIVTVVERIETGQEGRVQSHERCFRQIACVLQTQDHADRGRHRTEVTLAVVVGPRVGR